MNGNSQKASLHSKDMLNFSSVYDHSSLQPRENQFCVWCFMSRAQLWSLEIFHSDCCLRDRWGRGGGAGGGSYHDLFKEPSQNLLKQGKPNTVDYGPPDD